MLLQDEDRGPLPSQDELRTDGFAVWPEDTLAEGMDACEKAESWRLDPKETAFRFAREVLRYPEPSLNTKPLDDFEPTPWEFRYLIGSRGVRGVFLGSIVDVRKYDRCWFVVHLQPREEGWLPSIGFIHGDDGTQLVLRMEGPNVEIGYGDWQREVTWRRGGAQPPQVVLDPPEQLDPDATGHVMALAPFQDVFDGSASPLGSIPEPATTKVRPVGQREVEEIPRVCSHWEAHRQPLRAIADLYTFTLNSAVATRGRKVLFQRGDRAERVRGDRWLLHVDGVELTARIPELKQGCHRILSIQDGRRRLIESLHVEPERFTFELNWGRGSNAEIWLISGSGRGGGNWRLDRFDSLLTLRTYDRLPANEPFYVMVVLREGRSVISAERIWYRTQ